MSLDRQGAFSAADVEAWLAELGITPLERSNREGVTSWDVVLDGRRRASLRITLILDPALALICWCHFAPPINDSFRKSYRKLLRWNDELPFAKFAIGEDERPMLLAELPAATVQRDDLGLALARQVALADRYHSEATEWLKAGGWRSSPPADPDGPGMRLVARYSQALAELLVDASGSSTSNAAVDGAAASNAAVDGWVSIGGSAASSGPDAAAGPAGDSGPNLTAPGPSGPNEMPGGQAGTTG